MSSKYNINKNENEDKNVIEDIIPTKENNNNQKEEEQKTEEKQEKETGNEKKIFLQKLSLPFHKKKNNSINNTYNKNKNKDIILLRKKNQLYNNNNNKTSLNQNITFSKNNSNYINDIYKQNEFINLKKINDELMYNLEEYERENLELKNIIYKLNMKLKEKDEYIDDNEKLILKLKNNYLNLSNQYEQIEIEFKNIKNNKNEDDISKESIKKKEEIEKYKKKNNDLITNINKIKNDYDKIKKELQNISFAYQELKQKSGNFIQMLKDREKIIEENEKKIKELNVEINNKDAQLKLLNKYKNEDVFEKFKNKDLNINNNNYIFDKDNYKVNIFPMDEIFNIDILENKILTKNEISFKLEEALKDILYIPNNINMSITKEYLINMNFKTELIKLECFSNYIREFNYIEFLDNFSNVINSFCLKDIINQIYIIKSDYEKSKFDNTKYINEIKLLKNKIKELYLYIYDIKEKLYGANNNFQIKLNYLITLYEIKIQKIKNESKNGRNNRNNIMIYYQNDNKDNNDYLLQHINSIFIKSNNNHIRNNNGNDVYENLTFRMYKNPYNIINNKDNYQNSKNQKLDNNKLKEEIERLKNEISTLIKDINKQQNELSLLKNDKNKKNINNNTSFNYENLNKNIFTKSEYMKYSLIYDFTNINEIINVFYFMVNNTKQNIDKININKNNKDEFINLKNEHILDESLIEIIKNYLVVVEKIKIYYKEKNYEENFNKIKNIFNDGLFYKINDLYDKDIFLRKLINIIFEMLIQ